MQIEAGKEFHASLEGLISLLQRAEREVLGQGGESGEGERQALARGLGLWIPGQADLSWADVMAGPCKLFLHILLFAEMSISFPVLYRAKIVLTHYRGFQLPKGERFTAWLERLFEHPAFKATCSTDQLYLDSYERSVCWIKVLTHANLPEDTRLIGRIRVWLQLRSTRVKLCLKYKAQCV
jgi:glutathione S-transferase